GRQAGAPAEGAPCDRPGRDLEDILHLELTPEAAQLFDGLCTSAEAGGELCGVDRTGGHARHDRYVQLGVPARNPRQHADLVGPPCTAASQDETDLSHSIRLVPEYVARPDRTAPSRTGCDRPGFSCVTHKTQPPDASACHSSLRADVL